MCLQTYKSILIYSICDQHVLADRICLAIYQSYVTPCVTTELIMSDTTFYPILCLRHVQKMISRDIISPEVVSFHSSQRNLLGIEYAAFNPESFNVLRQSFILFLFKTSTQSTDCLIILMSLIMKIGSE